MDARERGEKNKVYDQRGKQTLLFRRSITLVSFFILMLTFISSLSSCRGSYYTDYKGERVNAEAIEHYNQGNAYSRNGDYARAIPEYTRALEIQPIAEMYNNRGLAYAAMGQYDQALADANKVIALDPQLAGAYYIRAWAYEGMKRKKEAIEAYRNFIKYASPQDTAKIEEAKKRIAELEKQR